jgi:hypothetical protein
MSSSAGNITPPKQATVAYFLDGQTAGPRGCSFFFGLLIFGIGFFPIFSLLYKGKMAFFWVANFFFGRGLWQRP